MSSAVPAAPLSVYGQLPGFETAALSPSGERMAIVGELSGERRLVVLEADSTVVLAFPLGDIKIRGIYWAGEQDVLIYKSNTQQLSLIDFTADKVELYSMVVVPLDGRKAWTVFDGNTGIVGGVSGFHGIREKNGKYFGYFGGITLEGSLSLGRQLVSTDPVLYEVSFETAKARKLANRFDGDGYRDWIIGPAGEVAATLDFFNGKGEWAIRNGSGRGIARGVQPTGDVSLVGLGASPDTIVYSVADEEGHIRWMEAPTAGGEGREILEDAAIRDAVFDERTNQLMGYIAEGDLPAYTLFDARRQKVMDATLKAFPGMGVHLEGWNQRFNKLIVRTEGSGDPGTWWTVDLTTGAARDIGVSYTLRAEEVGPVRMFRYTAADGLGISAVLTLPPGVPAEDLPVVVMPHGGPAARDYPEFDWWAQAFASRGYAVLQPNFRGSTGYNMQFLQAGHGEWGRKMQSDLSDGLAALAQEGIVDPARACIVGSSYGGYAALAGVTLQKDIYRCAVSVAGVSDLAEMVETDIRESGSNSTLIRVLRKEVGSGRDLRAVSPLRFADSANAPILLVHGRDDSVVSHAQSASMARALRQAGKPVEFLTLDGEDHWLSRSETRLAMLNRVVAFVEEHNPASPAPAD
ncbi:MAG: prolyl oligopeptidase family serine peptidase [Pseudomonadota bacterium]|nr:prolyl oligopeptidase family serine peptidase [Pseudomonadota bacterium]